MSFVRFEDWFGVFSPKAELVAVEETKNVADEICARLSAAAIAKGGRRHVVLPVDVIVGKADPS